MIRERCNDRSRNPGPRAHASGPTHRRPRRGRPFYRDGLGLEVLSEFRDHAGFDGVMLGQPGAGYHLEFTRREGHRAGRAPTEDNLLVFYLPDRAEWQQAVDRLELHGYRPVPAFNPYWERRGKTFADPDGYRVVLENAAWQG
jgi:catechol 2,3-dioxygenase-like lactoylglutathione lyase family enzyme